MGVVARKSCLFEPNDARARGPSPDRWPAAANALLLPPAAVEEADAVTDAWVLNISMFIPDGPGHVLTDLVLAWRQAWASGLEPSAALAWSAMALRAS